MFLHLAVGACCFFPGLLHAQTLAMPAGIPLTTATVSVAVSYDPTNYIFIYSYSVSNSKQSAGKIDALNIDISTAPNGASLGSNDLLNGATGYSGFGSATSLADSVGNATIPVGFKSQPAGWSSGPTAQFTASWYGPLPPGDYIAPGESLGAFVLTSHGLPGIRHFAVRPAYNSADFLPGIDDDSSEATQISDLDNEIQRVIQSQGYTIGPVQPPSLTDSGQLLDFMAALKHQAASLGWIYGPGSDGIVRSLDAKLTAAKASAASGDGKAAINQLNAFINELQAQRGKTISDNAFYLLQPNAQFIISKLGS